MKTLEYQAYKKHILNYMTVDELKTNLERHTPTELVRDGFFVCCYSQVLDVFKEVYGDEYRPETYLKKDGGLNGEPHQFGDEDPNTFLELDYLDKDEDGYTIAFLKDKDSHE